MVDNRFFAHGLPRQIWPPHMQVNYYHDFSLCLEKLLGELLHSQLLPSLIGTQCRSLLVYLIHHPTKEGVLSFSLVAPLYMCHLESSTFIVIQRHNQVLTVVAYGYQGN